MEISSIFVFVLALLVVGNVALAWIISDRRRETQAVALWRSTIDKRLSEYGAKWNAELLKIRAKLDAVEAQSPLELGVKVVELSEAVERLRKTHQKFAGRISQELGAADIPDSAITGGTPAQRDELRRQHARDIMPAGLKR